MQSHDRIVGIDPNLLVMSSIRKPKRITFYGGSGREHMFLVKGGEDLRNDERIEQLFVLMNSLLASSAASGNGSWAFGSAEIEAQSAGGGIGRGVATKNSSLRARTFTVVPMTSKVGILEWVPNTTPIKAIIQEQLGKDEAFVAANKQAKKAKSSSVDLMTTNASEKRFDWMGSNDPRAYLKLYKDKTSVDIQKLAREVYATTPTDVIRRHLLEMSSTAEAFVTLRFRFAKTLAASNTFGYILGELSTSTCHYVSAL
jgi:DNA-dependent protein kinase catalytic subunit